MKVKIHALWFTQQKLRPYLTISHWKQIHEKHITDIQVVYGEKFMTDTAVVIYNM